MFSDLIDSSLAQNEQAIAQTSFVSGGIGPFGMEAEELTQKNVRDFPKDQAVLQH